MAKLLQGDWLKVSVWSGSPVFVKQVRLGDTEVRLAMYFMKSSDPGNVADSSWYISASEPLSLPSGWQAHSHIARAWPCGTEYHMATMQWQVLWARCGVEITVLQSQLQEKVDVLQSQLQEASEVPDASPEELDTPIG